MRRQDDGPSGPRWRAILEARWRIRLQEVTELSLAYHAATTDGPDGIEGRHARRLLRRAVGARHRLADTEDALGRLASGRFGRCERCGALIPEAGPRRTRVPVLRPLRRWCRRGARRGGHRSRTPMSAFGSLQADSALSYLIALVIPALDAIFPVLPSETVVIALGVATAGSTDPRIAVLVGCAAAGAFLGDNLCYLLGRRSAPPCSAGSSPRRRA